MTQEDRLVVAAWNMVHNAAKEVRSGILTLPGQYPSENVIKRSVCCRNKTKYEEDSFSVFIQRLTSSTIASACTDV